MLGYVPGVQRKEIRQGIACVKHQNMSGSDIGDDHKEYFAGEAALKAGGVTQHDEPVLIPVKPHAKRQPIRVGVLLSGETTREVLIKHLQLLARRPRD